MKRIAILGATGSIGKSTIDVIQRHPGLFKAFALSANKNVREMLALCQQLQPEIVAMADPGAAYELEQALSSNGLSTQVMAGEAGTCHIASLPQVDTVMAAIVGAAGLKPTLAAVGQGKQILLANKEALVMTGQLFIEKVRASGSKLFPIDSEHNAIFQCLHERYDCGLKPKGVKKIVLTASGGPFHADVSRDLSSVTPGQAVSHPNWSMGKKISVDSATLMNKGLEVIEAHWLFGVDPDLIEVVIHPQSVVHSMVEFHDGSYLAQMGNPDMRTPIANAMAFPERVEAGVPGLDLCEVARLDFTPPDKQRFPCLRLAYKVLRQGGTAPAILNAANEVAVDAFLNGQCRFSSIPVIIERTLERVDAQDADSLDSVMEDDARARDMAGSIVCEEFSQGGEQ